MKILFIAILSLFVPVGALLLTGHSGAAEKITSILFFLLFGNLVWALIRR